MEYYKNKNKLILSDSDITFLAEAYLKLKANKTYQKMTRTFKEYVDEFLEKELLEIKKMKG